MLCDTIYTMMNRFPISSSIYLNKGEKVMDSVKLVNEWKTSHKSFYDIIKKPVEPGKIEIEGVSMVQPIFSNKGEILNGDFYLKKDDFVFEIIFNNIDMMSSLNLLGLTDVTLTVENQENGLIMAFLDSDKVIFTITFENGGLRSKNGEEVSF